MDAVALVTNQIDEGQNLLDRLGEEGIAVRAACWVKPIEEDRWTLCIATPTMDAKGPLEAYRQITPALRSLENGWLTSSDVRLVGEKHPLVKDALDILHRFPHWTKVKPPRPLFGGIPVEDEVYVYPLGKVEVTIYGMIFRGHPSGSLFLSFEKHDTHCTLVEESDGNRNEFRAEAGIDWVVAAPEGSSLERNEFGQLVLAWNRNGAWRRSGPNEVWSLAEVGLQGFRFLIQPLPRENAQTLGSK